MIPKGNFPQVRVGREPRQRTQHKPTQTNKTKTTAKKEDAQDSTTTRRNTCVAAKMENATDSIANTVEQSVLTTTNMATKENEADSLAKHSVLNREGCKALDEETNKTNTTMTMTWSTSTTEDSYDMTSRKLSEQQKIPNQIGITKRDPELTNVFRFVGEEKGECERPGQEPRTTFFQAGDLTSHGNYMDASQDYSSVRRKIVKPSN